MNVAVILAIVIVALVAIAAFVVSRSTRRSGPTVDELAEPAGPPNVASLDQRRRPKQQPPSAPPPQQREQTAKPKPEKKVPERKPVRGKKAPGGPEPSDDDIERLIGEAEELLRTESAKPNAPEGPDAGGEGPVADEASPSQAVAVEQDEPEPDDAGQKPTFRERLGRTRQAISDRLADIRLRRKVDDDVWDDLEETLILADVGADLSSELVDAARRRAADEKADTPDAVVDALKDVLAERLGGRDRELARAEVGPAIWFVVGVNGTGKTTTIGKLATRYGRDGEGVVLAAADTFRAAAADQLQIWADRSGAELVRGQEGADPGAIVFDAVSLTRNRNRNILLVDTAGRLHTKVNLMEELKKIRRTAEKAGGTPDEVLLVLDATTGQNGLVQAKEFAAAAGVTGVVLTKLDGTAKGGIAFAIEQQFGIPIKLVGLGEGENDLVEFDPDEFVDAIFS